MHLDKVISNFEHKIVFKSKILSIVIGIKTGSDCDTFLISLNLLSV